MEDLSWQVAYFILEKILSNDVGLDYIRCAPDCFFAFVGIAKNMLMALVQQPSSQLLKRIIICFLHLSKNKRLIYIASLLSFFKMVELPQVYLFVFYKIYF